MAWEWWQEHDHASWDRELARLGGHPLQSALWGEARRMAENIEYRCYVGRSDGVIAALARVEIRRIPLFGSVAWLPRGPICADINCMASLENFLRNEKYILCAFDPWLEVESRVQNSQATIKPRTIWIDLTIGKEKLWSDIDKQCRKGVRRVEREGFSIEQTTEPKDIDGFYQLCVGTSEIKGFKFPGNVDLMKNLISRSFAGGPVEAKLFVIRVNDEIGAGWFVIRAGKSAHNIWSSLDRKYASLRLGEALQWAVIEWAVDQGCALFDLEGIDPLRNPGTYYFKKKMWGREVGLAGMDMRPLGGLGWLAGKAISLRDQLKT